MANNRIRYNWGICTNNDADGKGNPCECCASKEKQRVLASREFVCRVCGEPLHRVQAPKTFMQKYRNLFIGLGALIVIGGAGAGIATLGGHDKTAATDSIRTNVKDSSLEKTDNAPSLAEEKQVGNQQSTPAKNQQATTSSGNQQVSESRVEKAPAHSQGASQPAMSGSKNLGYAVFKGTLKNGKPDDVNGRLIFKSSHVIDSRDPKGRVADAGDYVIGEFSEGHLVQGIWYGSDNVVKGSVIIGK